MISVDRWMDRQAGSGHLKSSSQDPERVHILLQQHSCLSAMFSLSAPRHPAALHMTKLVPVSAVIWPRMACLPDQNHSLPSPLLHWLLRTEETQATDPGFESQQTPQSSGTRKKASLPFKVAGLSLVYKYVKYKLYIYIPSEVSRFPEVKWQALGRWRKNNKWDCWGIDPWYMLTLGPAGSRCTPTL